MSKVTNGIENCRQKSEKERRGEKELRGERGEEGFVHDDIQRKSMILGVYVAHIKEIK